MYQKLKGETLIFASYVQSNLFKMSLSKMDTEQTELSVCSLIRGQYNYLTFHTFPVCV